MSMHKQKYILPEVSRHYWSIGNLGSKFRLPLVSAWVDPSDQSVHHFVVTFDEDNSCELALWEGVYVDGDLRYEALATKPIEDDHLLRQKANDFALWVFMSKKPELLKGVSFL